MNKLLAVVSLLFITSGRVQAQYYYKDIISNDQLVADMATYKEKKIHTIKIKSFENDGEPSEGFYCEKKISKNYKTAELFTRTSLSGASLFISNFNEKGKVISTSDSSEISVSHNSYYYDEMDRVKRIVLTVKSSDDDFTNEIMEEHIYTYNDENIATGMIRVKNRYDSTMILFLPDEKNNVSIEKDTKSGSKYYYYYNTNNKLTDVVHSNEFKQKLLPDYLFEYNAAGQLMQMTSTEEGGNNYYVWKYSYNDGLRIKERVYSKDRKLMGSIEYEYK